jgi:transposase
VPPAESRDYWVQPRECSEGGRGGVFDAPATPNLGSVPKAGPSKQDAVKRGATLVFIDETGFMMYPTTRKSFSPRGEPPVNYVTNPHGRISTIAAITFRPTDGHLGWHYAMLDDNNNFRGPGVVAFLRQLATGVSGPMTIVWDQIIIHSCEAVAEYLTTNATIKLEPFPPYAPELNPVDRAWFYIKYDRIPNLTPTTTKQLRRAAETELKRLRRCPALLRSFIRHSKLPLIECAVDRCV